LDTFPWILWASFEFSSLVDPLVIKTRYYRYILLYQMKSFNIMFYNWYIDYRDVETSCCKTFFSLFTFWSDDYGEKISICYMNRTSMNSDNGRCHRKKNGLRYCKTTYELTELTLQHSTIEYLVFCVFSLERISLKIAPSSLPELDTRNDCNHFTTSQSVLQKIPSIYIVSQFT